MALKLGVDSVMCDGSALPYEENVAWTAMMAQKAHAVVSQSVIGLCVCVNVCVHVIERVHHARTPQIITEEEQKHALTTTHNTIYMK